MAKHILHGVPISSGIAIGKAVFVRHHTVDDVGMSYIACADVAEEKSRFLRAVKKASRNFASALANLPKNLKEEAEVITMHAMMCEDPVLLKNTLENIENKLMGAESALQVAINALCQSFAAIEDEHIRERVHDLRIVGERIMDQLAGRVPEIIKSGGPVVLMARDLSPADTLELSLENVLAMVTEDGGRTSHAGILARSMGIPAIVGVAGLQTTARSEQKVIIDGLKGTMLIDPSESEEEEYKNIAAEFERYKERISVLCQNEAETLDGHRVEVLGNVGWPEEVPKALAFGAEGVGLYRTEFSYMNRTSSPSEEELFKEYSEAVKLLEGRSICFRTLDLGSDKLPYSHTQTLEANPALGLRATRYCLRNPSLFRRQLRALFRALARANGSIMFPLVADLKEMRLLIQLVGEVKQDLASAGEPLEHTIPMGIMVELPSTILMAEELAEEVDFFSVGTNDLIQYTLGVDRANSSVSHLYQPLHPAVLRSIKWVVDVAHRYGVPVNVCGEMASDPYCLPVLLGMPVDTISMSAQSIPAIKSIIRKLSLEECIEFSREILKYDTTDKINRMVSEFLYSKTGEDLAFHFSSSVGPHMS